MVLDCPFCGGHWEFTPDPAMTIEPVQGVGTWNKTIDTFECPCGAIYLGAENE